ncbi:hypothetical protein MXB_5452 [Myxobolus squamalis]|nr:hypothetical protein MXB_5452 [Myxobolus squamalis]
MEFLSKSFHDITEGDLVVTGKFIFMTKDFSCSLQSDVLIQGRIYLSYYGYYFHSKILGFITTACGYWVDVCELKKDKAAYLLPIILHITTNSEKVFIRTRNTQHTFSFIQNRNTAYAIIKMIWLNHRNQVQLSPEQVIEKAEEILKSVDIKLVDEMSYNCGENHLKPTLSCPNDNTHRSIASLADKSGKAILKGNLFFIILKFCCDLETIRFLAFDANSPIMPILAHTLALQDFKINRNSLKKDGVEITNLSYLYPVGFPFSPVSTETIQEFFPCNTWNQDHCKSCSHNTLYSECFRALIRYCFVRNSDIIEIKVYFKIEYLRQVTSMVRSIIDNRSSAKTFEYITTLLNLVENHLSKLPISEKSNRNSLIIPELAHAICVDNHPLIIKEPDVAKTSNSHPRTSLFNFVVKILSILNSNYSKSVILLVLLIIIFYLQLKIIQSISLFVEHQKAVIELLSEIFNQLKKSKPQPVCPGYSN